MPNHIPTEKSLSVLILENSFMLLLIIVFILICKKLVGLYIDSKMKVVWRGEGLYKNFILEKSNDGDYILIERLPPVTWFEIKDLNNDGIADFKEKNIFGGRFSKTKISVVLTEKDKETYSFAKTEYEKIISSLKNSKK